MPIPSLRPRRIAARSAILTLALASLGLIPAQALGAGPNLLPNGDLRADASGFTAYAGRGLPAKLTWKSTGDQDPGSLSASFLDGSAGGPAWYGPEVPVADGNAYIIRTSSRGAASELLARFTLSDGSARYRSLKVVPQSSSWQRNVVRVSAPAGSTTVAIYQEITAAGTLETDDYAVALATVPDLSSGIPNGDFEQSDDLNISAPLGWSGHPMSSATYSTAAGRTGGRAVKVALSRYKAGQAAAYWETDPTAITPGGYYQFTDWYRSDVESRAYVEIMKADGSYREIALKSVGPSPLKFTRYQTRFLLPSWAKAVSLIHVPLGKGSLTTDDYSLVSATTGRFDRATVSLTFDDGNDTDMLAAAPALAGAGVRASFYPISGYLGQPGYVTGSDLRSLVSGGHEVGSHTVTHPDLVELGSARRLSELVGSKVTLEGILGPGTVSGIASPYGSYDSSVLGAMTTVGYRYNRTLDEGINEPDDWDPMRLRSYLMLNSTTPQELQELLQRAAADHTWLVLVWHDVDETGDFYATPAAQLTAQLAQITASGARVLPVREALAVLTPQVPKSAAAVKARKKARMTARSRRHPTPFYG